jgi:hypothetical protein
MAYEQLQQQIDELKEEINRLKSPDTFPLEIVEALVRRGFLKSNGILGFYGGASGNYFENLFIEAVDREFILGVEDKNLYRTFYVNTSTNVCTSVNHGLENDQTVILYSTKTLPAGIDAPVSFYIKNATTNTFKLSFDGTTTLNITSEGVGTHYVYPY